MSSGEATKGKVSSLRVGMFRIHPQVPLDMLHRGLYTKDAFFRAIYLNGKKIELLIGYEFFHTECQYHAVKTDPFVSRINVDFSELLHCKQMHHPIMVVVREGRRISHKCQTKPSVV